MLLGLVGMLAAPAGRWAKTSLVLYAASATAAILFDQMRMQPWAYQFVLLSLVLALAQAGAAIALVRLLIASFYFYSALTKLDYSFLHTLGQQFLASLAGACGLSVDGLSEQTRLSLALMFPLGELAIAIGLLWRRTRPVALLGAV